MPYWLPVTLGILLLIGRVVWLCYKAQKRQNIYLTSRTPENEALKEVFFRQSNETQMLIRSFARENQLRKILQHLADGNLEVSVQQAKDLYVLLKKNGI